MPDLKTHIAVSALMRRAQSAGAFAVIVRKGDVDSGAYIVVTRQQGSETYTLYRPIRNAAGARIWWPKGSLSQTELDRYINRRIDEDPDIWVVEIEDSQGRHFLIEPVEVNVSPIDSDDDKALKSAIKDVFPDR